jgi:hypothetical protein
LLGTLEVGQTLVVRGMLDDSSSDRYDTYSFDVTGGVDGVETYATWSFGSDIGELHVWDELSSAFSSANGDPAREPATGTLVVNGWVPPERGYVAIRSYQFVPIPTEIPYTLYIIGSD